MKKITGFVILVMLVMGVQGLRAQDTLKIRQNNNVVLLYRCYGDSIVFRWAPEDPGLWMLTNTRGWILERSLTDKEIKASGDSTRIDTVLNGGQPIRPLTLEQFQARFDSTDMHAGAAAQALYGQGVFVGDPNSKGGFVDYVFRKDQEQHQRHFMAMMAAEGRPDIMSALGMRYVDRTVQKGEWYDYTLSTPVPKHLYDVAPRAVILHNVPYVRQQDEMMPEIQIQQIDAYRAVVYWEKNKLSGYFIERKSSKDRNWVPLNSVPLYGYNPDEETYKVFGEDVARIMEGNVAFIDSLDLKVQYQYRVRAFDAFGDYVPFKEGGKFEMLDLIPPSLPIITGCVPKDNVTCTVYWEKDVMEDDFEGYVLTFSDSPDGPWSNVSDVLGPKTKQYVDEYAGARGRGYYKLIAFDKFKNVSFSSTALNNIEDVVPPVSPTGLKALVDTAGVAHFAWNRNPEKDVLGYRVFFANQMDHEFVECSHGLVEGTEFRDTLDWHTITKYAYYYITAEDNSHNVSAHSDTIAVPVPDKIPPTPCILDDITVTDNAVVVRWTKSASTDVMYYFIYRKFKKQKQWELQQAVQPWQIAAADYIVFIDHPTPSSEMYQYCIEAVDDFHNTSGRSGYANAFVREARVVDIPIQLAATADKKNNAVNLKWSYDYMGRHSHYGLIFRSVNGSEYKAYQRFEKGTTTFTDYSLNSGDKASYYIVLYLGKGQRSLPSQEAKAGL